MDRDARVLVRVLAVLGRDGVLLEVHGLAGIEAAVLEDNGGVAEYEVHRAVDVAFAEELPLRVHVERVLVANHVAPVDHRVVRSDPQRYCLVLLRSGPVLESDVSRNESRSRRRCITIIVMMLIVIIVGFWFDYRRWLCGRWCSCRRRCERRR